MNFRIDLCGKWRFQPASAHEGVHRGWFRPEHDVGRWLEVNLPASFEDCLPALGGYEGEGWFRRSFPAPAGWRGRRVTVRFQGVNDHTSVWINGKEVGEHADGFLPFEFAVHEWLRWGEQNVLVVRADNVRRRGEVPGLQRGWLPVGGILREVELIATDMVYLDHVSVVAEPIAEGGQLMLRAKIKNDRREPTMVSISASVAQDDEILSTFDSSEHTCAPNQSITVALGGLVRGIQPWSTDQPRLYTARVEVRADGRVVDERSVRIGFRRIETRAAGLYLNGEPIYLTGFNRHEDSPRTGTCPDAETTRQDLLDMKAAGANFIRLCHYPHHPGELDLCDELGLLALGEIPLIWWDGLAEGEKNCAGKLAAAERQLTAMIQRDINHPSLILWSVSNETHEQRSEVAAGNTALLKLARSLDPTRLATHASNHWREGEAAQLDARFEADLAVARNGEPERTTASTRHATQFDSDDVICVNAYPSLNRRSYGGQHDYDFVQSTAYWREQLAQLHERYPHKPILVSEFGYVSFEGVFGSDFGEDTQAEAIAHEFAGMDAPYVCGAVIWCWADHRWAQGGFCHNLVISPYGVVTRARRKLRAYHTIQKLFSARQRMTKPHIANASNCAADLEPNQRQNL